MRRQHSSPPVLQPAHPRSFSSITTSRKSSSQGSEGVLIPSPEDEENIPEEPQTETLSMRQRRPLVNREATNFQDDVIGQHRDFLLVAPPTLEHSPGAFADVEDRQIPLIPFEELMLIETLGMGRVSTIYRAAWKRGAARGEVDTPVSVGMVALKVATVNPDTGDTFHVDELRREADIAALLKHNNICDLVGVAADAECFCIAYEFCEGGSLLSLLSDTSRYYEYLPIALDIANGMAYLHSRNVIHRDLKPSNILLTRDHRAKISDFGMSVANTGQELTAETGTYRYMAPEVIRHEVYSSNADVYSFGIVLWQLITREVPFATMTPIQAAFAVAGGRRPEIPLSTPPRLRALIEACWDQDSHKRPSFAWIGMELADYARMAFSPANVGAQTLNIANEMLANVVGESNVNVDPSVAMGGRSASAGDMFRSPWFGRASSGGESYSYIGGSSVGLEI
jgi:serine/threonine protein kinase